MSAPTDPVPGLELLDLREVKDESLLEAVYTELYVPNFPIANEAENPSMWRRLLWSGVPSPPNPILRVLVAGRQLRNPGARVLVGFLFAELYLQIGIRRPTSLATESTYSAPRVSTHLISHA